MASSSVAPSAGVFGLGGFALGGRRLVGRGLIRRSLAVGWRRGLVGLLGGGLGERRRVVGHRGEIGQDVGARLRIAHAGEGHRRAAEIAARIGYEMVELVVAPGLSGGGALLHRGGVVEPVEMSLLGADDSEEVRPDPVLPALFEGVAGGAGPDGGFARRHVRRGQQRAEVRAGLFLAGHFTAFVFRHRDLVAGLLGVRGVENLFRNDAQSQDDHAGEQDCASDLVEFKAVHAARAPGSSKA